MAMVAAGGAMLAVRDAHSAIDRALGFDFLAQAESEQASAERDVRLDDAQAHLSEALDVRVRDPAAWLALARVRFLQATGAEIGTVSPVLLDASAAAAARAEEIDAQNVLAPVRIAEAYSLASPMRFGEAADALARSYALKPIDLDMAEIRVHSGARIWPHLTVDQRMRVLDEACALYAAGRVESIDALSVGAGDPMVAAAFDGIRQQPRCAPLRSQAQPAPSDAAHPDSSPPAPPAQPE